MLVTNFDNEEGFIDKYNNVVVPFGKFKDCRSFKNGMAQVNSEDLGEIYICYDICLKNAKKYGNSFDREFCFLFIHGLLHLLGYDHQTKEQEEVMFKLQDEILPPKEN